MCERRSCARCWRRWRAVGDPAGLGTARIFVRPGATDMRKQINGLVLLVQEQMQLSPFEAALFVFCNGQRRVLKAVYWDQTGFCLWMKRLERGRFPWPQSWLGTRTSCMGASGCSTRLKPAPTANCQRMSRQRNRRPPPALADGRAGNRCRSRCRGSSGLSTCPKTSSSAPVATAWCESARKARSNWT